MYFKTIKLTPAQISALECREGGGLDPLTEAAWLDGGRCSLRFPVIAAEALADELNDSSNAEDAQYEQTGCVFAYRAAVSFGAVSGKVLRAV